jgi:hypothetical protein
MEVERQRQAELALGRSDHHDDAYWREPDRTSTFPAHAESFLRPEPKHATTQTKAKPKREPKVRAAHERPSVAFRANGVAAAIIMILVALLIGAGINWLGPDLAGAQRPFTKSGEPGQSINARTFTVTVRAARAAPALQIGKSTLSSQGAWVIVGVHLVANTQPTHVGYAALRDRAGRTYLATDRITQPLLDGTRTFQPGIPVDGEVAFEVPKDALAGLTALFAARPDQVGMDAMAAVTLPALSVAPDQPAATLAPTEVKA